MNDNEIIKALECCRKLGKEGCEICPLQGINMCNYVLMNETRNYVYRQKAEIEELTILCDMQDKNMIEQKVEIERLAAINKEMLKDLRIEHDLRIEDIRYAKSAAIKEFAKRLKERMSFGDIVTCVTHAVIDNLVKEMTEGKE